MAPAVKIPLAAGIYSTTAAGRKHVRSLGLVSSDNRDRYLKKEKNRTQGGKQSEYLKLHNLTSKRREFWPVRKENGNFLLMVLENFF